MTKEQIAKNIVSRIFANLSNRSGINHILDSLDVEVEDEIRQSWINIVKEELDVNSNS